MLLHACTAGLAASASAPTRAQLTALACIRAQAGLGSILLSSALLAGGALLLAPRLDAARALAAALAAQYFGLLLLPRGPEDAWLLQGLAGWLADQALKQLVGVNEIQYRRWQVRALGRGAGSCTVLSCVRACVRTCVRTCMRTCVRACVCA